VKVSEDKPRVYQGIKMAIHRTRFTTTVMVLLFSAIAVSGAHGQKRKPFSLDLSSHTLKLWSEMEQYYGQPIQERALEFTTGGYGQSGIDDDGTPWISLSPPGRFEENVIHELMHLKLKSQGFPAVYFASSSVSPEFLGWATLTIKDSIEHWIFYPEIRKMGFKPDPEMAVDLRDAINHDRFQADLPPESAHHALAIYYFEAMLLIDDECLKKDTTEWYRRKEWVSEMKLGQAMANIVLERRPDTPEEETSTFVDCLNLLLDGKVAFDKGSWSNLQRGNVSIRSVLISEQP
jgi:hypothetical protein